jgi:hypothetical protein
MTFLDTHAYAPAVTPETRIPAGRDLPRPQDIRSRDLLGLPIAMTDYVEAMDVMDGMVARRERGYVCATAVHAVMVAQSDPEMREALRRSTLTVPDGMPLVWAANLLGEDLRDRVYGPELMLRYCERSRDRGHRVFLYGGRDQGSLAQLTLNLRLRFPGIKIVGGYSPPFRLSRTTRTARSPPRSTPPARTSCGSASGSPSRRSGWRGCATGSKLRSWPLSAPPSTSTRDAYRWLRSGCSRVASSGPIGSRRSRAGCFPAI